MVSPELRDKVSQFVDCEITAVQLEEWVVPRLRLFLHSPETADEDVIAAIALGLVEMSDGIRTEDEFRNLMRQVLLEHAAPWATITFAAESADPTSSANRIVNLLVRTPPSATATWTRTRVLVLP